MQLEMKLTEPLPSMSLAGLDPKRIQKLRLLRLRCAVPAMGLPQVRHLHLPLVCGRPQGVRGAHLVRAVHLDGRLQGGRDRAHAPRWQRELAYVLGGARGHQDEGPDLGRRYYRGAV